MGFRRADLANNDRSCDIRNRKGINDAGQVVGEADPAAAAPTGTRGSLKFHAFLWRRGPREMGGHVQMIDLGSLELRP